MMKSPVDVFSYWQDAPFKERCVPHGWKSTRQPRAGRGHALFVDHTLVGIRIEWRPVPIEPQLQPAAFEIGRAVNA
jgi:hypothetical protein